MLVPTCAVAHFVYASAYTSFQLLEFPATKVKRVTDSKALRSFLFSFFYIIHLVLSTSLQKYLVEYIANRNDDSCQRLLQISG